MNPPSRNRQLDLLRGLAILLVLGRHLPEGTTLVTGLPTLICRYWFRIGWMGVDLFFVLSGFLISGLLFAEFQSTGSLNYKRFILRRGLRIWPAFYLMIAVSYAIVWPISQFRQVLVEIFFLQSYFSEHALWLHTWTLAVEEHFYFALGLLLLLLSKNRTSNPFRLIPLLWLVSAFACLLFRIWTPYDSPDAFTRTHARIDALFFGVTLSYFHHYHKEALRIWVRRLWPLMIPAIVLLLRPVFLLDLGYEPFLSRFGLTCTYLAFGMLLLLFLFLVPASPKPSVPVRALSWIGVRSYSIYLWHFPVAYLVAQPLALKIGGTGGLWWAVFFYILGALLTGYVCYEFFEKPILGWRDRRFSSPAKTAF